MASFALLITSPPIDSQSSATAVRFANQIIENGHRLVGVFFYGAGVHNGNRFETMLNDEWANYGAWVNHANKYSTPLYLCVTAANRRGLQSETDAKQNPVDDQFNIEMPFESVGLGEWFALCKLADRTVQF